MNIKKIIREEIKKLDESVESDLVLPKGKRVVLRADNPEVNRGLIVTWLEKGGYNVEYWYKDPSKIYPAEVKIDGESITKDGKVVYVGYHPDIDEGFGGEFLSKKDRKIFEKERLENAEVLGYKLTGTKDINEATATFRGARGRSVVVPNEYVGKLGRVEHKLMKMLGYTGGKHNIIADWSWGYNSRQKMKPNDEFSSSIILRSHPYIKGGRRELQKGDVKVIIVTLNKLLRANRLKIEKPKYRPDVNYPMIEFRVKPNQFKESVNESKSPYDNDDMIKDMKKKGYIKKGQNSKVRRGKVTTYLVKHAKERYPVYFGNTWIRALQIGRGGRAQDWWMDMYSNIGHFLRESVFAVNLDKEKNDERHPEQPNINYDPEKGKSRIRKIRENKSLITEGTRWFVGVEMPNGKTTSTYGHWDGYPSYTGKMLKRYYSGGAGKVRDLLKLGKHGISSLDKSIKGGKGHSFENPLPGETVFYGRDRGDKQRMVRNWKNKDSIKFNYYGAEFGYIWSVKDRKWYVKDDSSRTDWKVL